MTLKKTNTCVSTCGNRLKNFFMERYKEDGYIIIPIDSSDFPPDGVTKADLKSGMVIERRDGKRRLCIDIGGYIMLLNPAGYMNDLVHYDSNLCHKQNNMYDIMAVKTIQISPGLQIMLTHGYDNGVYMYQRKEPNWSKIPVDTLVQVYSYNTNSWRYAYFAGILNGLIRVFSDGKTSKTAYGITESVLSNHCIRIAE